MSEIICRICLLITSSTDKMCYIFEKRRRENLSQKIMKIANVQIHENDNITSYICLKCADNVEKFIDFKKEIEETNLYLKTIKTKECENLNENETKNEEITTIEILEDFKSEECENLNENETKNEEITTIEILKNLKSKEYENLNENETKNEEITTIEILENFKSEECENLSENEETTTIEFFSNQLQEQDEEEVNNSELENDIKIIDGEISEDSIESFNLEESAVSFEKVENKENPKIVKTSKQVQCTVCGRTLSPNSLANHMRIHTGEMPYRCSMCPRTFRTNSHLQYHIRVHRVEKNFSCEFCENVFTTRTYLIQHLRTHTGERPHLCFICGKKLQRLYNLKRHMLTHTGEKNFKCDICGLAFKHKHDVKRHLRTHDTKTLKLKKRGSKK